MRGNAQLKAARCCHLANATELLTPVLWPVGGSELRSYFSRLWTKLHRITFAYYYESVRSLQRRFPIVDVLLRSGVIRDQVAKLCEIAPKFWCFR